MFLQLNRAVKLLQDVRKDEEKVGKPRFFRCGTDLFIISTILRSMMKVAADGPSSVKNILERTVQCALTSNSRYSQIHTYLLNKRICFHLSCFHYHTQGWSCIMYNPRRVHQQVTKNRHRPLYFMNRYFLTCAFMDTLDASAPRQSHTASESIDSTHPELLFCKEPAYSIKRFWSTSNMTSGCCALHLLNSQEA